MAILRQALFNGGTNGAAITTLNETGLTSVSGSSLTFNTESYEGSLAARSPTGVFGSVNMNLGANANLLYARAYFMRKAGSANIQFFDVINNDPTVVAQVRWNSSTGKIQLRNGNTVVATSTYTWPVDTWVRIDWRVNRAGNTQEARLFHGANINGAIGSQDETLSGACTMGTLASVREVQAGLNSASTGASVLIDALALGDDWIGPYASGGGGPATYTAFEWNGSSEVPLTVEGVWNGSTVDTGVVEGTWDGADIV